MIKREVLKRVKDALDADPEADTVEVDHAFDCHGSCPFCRDYRHQRGLLRMNNPFAKSAFVTYHLSFWGNRPVAMDTRSHFHIKHVFMDKRRMEAKSEEKLKGYGFKVK